MLNGIIKFFLYNKLVTFLLLIGLIMWGIVTAPFNWQIDALPRDPVPVDAIPDIGENQQIVFTEWMGRSPQDVEDQITYPLTTALLGMPGVTTIRSTSMFGFSSIYIIFNDDVDYYWSRSRVLEKLSSLQSGLLPEGIQPTLGPDATALGQIYWYTLEGRDQNGNPAGGWDPHELRSIQDFYVRYGLSGAEGVSEVASIGGFVKEYQVDLDPNAMRVYNISMMQVVEALQQANQDVGANTIEINMVEYLVRGLGYVQNLDDIEQAVVSVTDNVPVRIMDIARVNIGPAPRGHSGFLDKDGVEAVGGVVVARYGDNPLRVIQNVQAKIDEISVGLPSRTLADGTVSKVTIVPFYDRTHLIYETLGTLYEAISLQILITIIVIIVMVMHLRTSLLISILLPLGVLMTFVMMKYFGVDANIVALSGIAIAIGTMVDLGIIMSENILRHKDEAPPGEPFITTVYRAVTEVSTAILTAVSTTIISFLPVFTLQAAEGKLFSPLAFTKTFALIAALIITFVFIPAFAHLLLSGKENESSATKRASQRKLALAAVLIVAGVVFFWILPWAGIILILLGINDLIAAYSLYQSKRNADNIDSFSAWHNRYFDLINLIIIIGGIGILLAMEWMPLGVQNSLTVNFIFILIIVLVVLGGFRIFLLYYPQLLNWCLQNKKIFLSIPAILLILALVIWVGFSNVFGIIPRTFDQVNWNIRATSPWSTMTHAFPGLGKEFMPSLDEGSFLLMPTSMPHSGVEANLQFLQQLDMRVQSIPEVEMVVGKAGRAETALDPAPISMFENIIQYKTEFLTDENGYPLRFKTDRQGRFLLKGDRKEIDGDRNEIMRDVYFDRGSGRFFDENNREIPLEQVTQIHPNLISNISTISPQNISTLSQSNISTYLNSSYLVPDKFGKPYRQWRDHIKSPDDIWDEIVASTADIPGVTSAPRLQPIETRLVMLQTGMRAPMGIKVFGPDLQSIEDFSLQLEQILKEVPSVKPEAVYADRSLGKPYLEIELNRAEMARYGLSIGAVQHYIEVAIGGMAVSTTVEGRERYNIRVRYAREFRDDPQSVKQVLLATPSGAQIPLGDIAEIQYRAGPMMIRGENTFLVGYVLLDKKEGFAEVTVVNDAQRFLAEKIRTGELVVPAGVTYQFSGTYENQLRAEKRLSFVIPIVLVLIFLILYFQFRSVPVSFMIFTSIAIAFAGGFLMLWLYGQDWFLNFSAFGNNIRDTFQVRNFNLSVAVWVGFIALFGIATDDGVVIATYLKQSFEKSDLNSVDEVRAAVMEAGKRRVRPCLMTTATTLLALLPILTSTGRGSDIMIPMAVPIFGGMTIALITLFVVPVLYSWWEERRINNIEIN